MSATINTYKVGDIYLIRFHPSIGTEMKRFRPACIVSTQAHQLDPRFILIAPFTTNTSSPDEHLEIPIKNPCLEKPSLLLTWYLQTIDVTRIERKLGQLNPNQIILLNQSLSKLLMPTSGS